MSNKYFSRYYDRLARENTSNPITSEKIMKLVEARANLGYWYVDIGELPPHVRTSLEQDGFEVTMAPNREWRIVWYMGDENL